MANATLLSLFQTTLQGMGVATYGMPTTVIGNTNQDVVQTLALVQTGGDELVAQHTQGWEAQDKQYIFTTPFYTYTGDLTNGSTTINNMSSTTGLTSTPTYFMVTGNGVPQDCFLTAAGGGTVTLNQAATASGTGVTLTFSQVLFVPPADFHSQIDRTHWDKSKHWEMLGPSTPQQREWLRSGYISTGPRIRYWYQGGLFMIWPPLGVTDSLSYEYRSKWWILATGATSVSKQLFTADTDTTIWPDSLMRAMIRLKYLEAKGMDTTAAYEAFNMQRDMAIANDGGSPTLSMNPRPSSVLIGWENIPDANYGS
jgi:hypothetical protein